MTIICSCIYTCRRDTEWDWGPVAKYYTISITEWRDNPDLYWKQINERQVWHERIWIYFSHCRHRRSNMSKGNDASSGERSQRIYLNYLKFMKICAIHYVIGWGVCRILRALHSSTDFKCINFERAIENLKLENRSVEKWNAILVKTEKWFLEEKMDILILIVRVIAGA